MTKRSQVHDAQHITNNLNRQNNELCAAEFANAFAALDDDTPSREDDNPENGYAHVLLSMQTPRREPSTHSILLQTPQREPSTHNILLQTPRREPSTHSVLLHDHHLRPRTQTPCYREENVLEEEEEEEEKSIQSKKRKHAQSDRQVSSNRGKKPGQTRGKRGKKPGAFKDWKIDYDFRTPCDLPALRDTAESSYKHLQKGQHFSDHIERKLCYFEMKKTAHHYHNKFWVLSTVFKELCDKIVNGSTTSLFFWQQLQQEVKRYMLEQPQSYTMQSRPLPTQAYSPPQPQPHHQSCPTQAPPPCPTQAPPPCPTQAPPPCPTQAPPPCPPPCPTQAPPPCPKQVPFLQPCPVQAPPPKPCPVQTPPPKPCPVQTPPPKPCPAQAPLSPQLPPPRVIPHRTQLNCDPSEIVAKVQQLKKELSELKAHAQDTEAMLKRAQSLTKETQASLKQSQNELKERNAQVRLEQDKRRELKERYDALQKSCEPYLQGMLHEKDLKKMCDKLNRQIEDAQCKLTDIDDQKTLYAENKHLLIQNELYLEQMQRVAKVKVGADPNVLKSMFIPPNRCCLTHFLCIFFLFVLLRYKLEQSRVLFRRLTELLANHSVPLEAFSVPMVVTRFSAFVFLPSNVTELNVTTVQVMAELDKNQRLDDAKIITERELFALVLVEDSFGQVGNWQVVTFVDICCSSPDLAMLMLTKMNADDQQRKRLQILFNSVLAGFEQATCKPSGGVDTSEASAILA